MTFNKSEKVLLVAPNIFSVHTLEGGTQIRHVTSADRVFPAIFEMVPNIIIFDYDHLSEDIEKILRRIRTNSYYNKMKICCFKSGPDRKLDSFLKMLGVNHVIYKDDLNNHDSTAINQVKSIFNSDVTDLLVNIPFSNPQ